MSIDVMSLIFKAKIEPIKMEDKTVSAPTLKFILVALADHCNDDGDGAYPSLVTLEHKTALSHQSVLNALEALKHQGLIIRVGISRRGTTNYSINVPMLKSLVHQIDYLAPSSTPDMAGSKSGRETSKPGGKGSQPGLPEPSLIIHEPSINQEEKPENEKLIDTLRTAVFTFVDHKDFQTWRRLETDLTKEGVSLSRTDHTITVTGLGMKGAFYQQRYGRSIDRALAGIFNHPEAHVEFGE
jgi:hypothetical protein